MRALIVLLVLVVLIGIVAIATGFVSLNGSSGSLPKLSVQGGSMPKVDAQVGHIDLGTKQTTVKVPKVETETQNVSVPTMSIKKAGEQ